MTTRLPPGWDARLRLPMIAAPMLHVSGPELVVAACAAGVIGAFPTANAGSSTELEDWIGAIKERTAPEHAPFAANLIMRSPRFDGDLEVLLRNGAELIITSVGSPAAAVGPLHDAGAVVLADVATLRHAERAVESGVDGVILLTAGAGGQSGWLNPFAFVRAIRSCFPGLVVLAGGVTDGRSLRAARVLGCDLAYMGTAFVATTESRAQPAYKDMVVDSTADDVVLTEAFTGLPTNMLAGSIRAAGLDPNALPEGLTPDDATALYGHGGRGPRRWKDIWSAGQSVSGVSSVQPTGELVERIKLEYEAARNE
jgi:nitronate monooxygenase